MVRTTLGEIAEALHTDIEEGDKVNLTVDDGSYSMIVSQVKRPDDDSAEIYGESENGLEMALFHFYDDGTAYAGVLDEQHNSFFYFYEKEDTFEVSIE